MTPHAAPASGPLTLAEVEAAARRVYAAMRPTPQVAWPLVAKRAGTEVWVKHENHTPTGAFKVRGGLNLLGQLADTLAPPAGVASATPGNPGQRPAFAARGPRPPCHYVHPPGNSRGMTAATHAADAVVVEHGRE